MTLAVALVAFVTLLLGEAWRVPEPGLSREAPLAQATIVALVISTSWPVPARQPEAGGQGWLVLGPYVGLVGPLLLAVLATLVVALVRGPLRSVPGELLRSALTALVTGVLVRVPLPTGRTLHDYASSAPGAQRGFVALLLLLAAAAAVAAPLLVRALARARLDQEPFWSVTGAELRRHGLLAAAAATTGVVTALAVQVLGPVSFVLVLVPLMVLLPAVGRQRQIRAAQRQTIFALARLTDQAGLTSSGHAARVARLAVPVAREVGVEDADLADVETAALLHDVGQVGLRRPIPDGATTEVSAVDQRRVATAGAAILARTAELSRLAPTVADVGIPHHRAVVRGDVPLASRVVRVASAYDDHLASARPVDAVVRLLRSTPHEYDPAVVGALVRHLERRGTLSTGEAAALRALAAARGPAA
ncbi:HD-GYP domain-containing protein [Ornithinimicrobium tianjinense]|uniref:HD domain-containing protein n=1 Tax=Ornithinimicrobium tianjinense TaxID=1195761 RepID=A0A917BMI5_9MICO|nr:HD domain-containing protein [Ornithinimicrobium tianjinense]GGF51834.1 hypothetical protein GCM10011366_19630 [Ornithinimicrobium tianjinense]